MGWPLIQVLNLIRSLDWSGVWLGVDRTYIHKREDTGLRGQSLLPIPGSIVNMIGMTYMVLFKKEKGSTWLGHSYEVHILFEYGPGIKLELSIISYVIGAVDLDNHLAW